MTGLAAAGRAVRRAGAVGRGPRPGPPRRRRGGGGVLLPRRRRPSRSTGRRRGAASSAGRARSTGGPTAVVVPVPPGAVRAVLQFEKPDGHGSIRIDDVQVTASPNPQAGTWTPYHVEPTTPTAGSRSPPSPAIVAELGARRLVPARRAGRQARVRDRQGRPAGLRQGGPGAVLRRQPAAPDRLPRARAGRRAGRPPGPVGGQPRPARRPRHAARPRPQPLRRHPRRHQGVRPRGPGQARPPDRRPQGAGDLRRARAPGRPAVPRPRTASPMPGLLPPGGGPAAIFDPAIAQARDRRPPGPCSTTSTPRPAWPCATTRPWPGSRWRARSRSST